MALGTLRKKSERSRKWMNFLFHGISSNRVVFFFISGSLTTGPESWIVPRISLRTRGRRRKQKTYWISVKSTSLVIRPSCRGCSPERLSRRKSEPKKSTEPDMKSDPKRGQMLWEIWLICWRYTPRMVQKVGGPAHSEILCLKHYMTVWYIAKWRNIRKFILGYSI